MTVEYSLEGRIARIVMNRPEKKNAMNKEMRKRLVEGFAKASDDPDVWLVVISGAGDAFSSGFDLSEKFAERGPEDQPGAVYEALLRITKPVIAKINGICLAQGAGVALLSDIRVAAEGVRLGWPQVRVGTMSNSGPSVLSRVLPTNIAFEFLFTGEFISAHDARRLQLLNHVVPARDLDAKVDEISAKILRNAPLAIQAVKGGARAADGLDQVGAIRAVNEFNAVANLTASEDAAEGMAAFREKREPVWQGR